MDLAELVSEVGVATSRPDLTARITQAVKAATLKLHNTDYYFKDMVNSTVLFNDADYIQSLEYKTVFPLWRNLKYLRKYDSANATATKFLDIITPDFVVDGYSVNREDVCYMAGQLLHLRSSTVESMYLIGYYKYPDITADGWDSWIAAELPYAIIHEASRAIYKGIGKDEEYVRMENESKEWLQQIRIVGNADFGAY
jgi:hypothetical protein